MKKIFIFAMLLSAASSYAATPSDPFLNTVTLQLRAEEWVMTKTALVSVNIDASVSGKGVEALQAAVLQKLNFLSNKGEWHITTFNRQLDKSGLEQMQIAAEARLPQSELASLRDKAKSLSKPGDTLTISNIEFIPSEDDFRQAYFNLRNNIYQQSKNELEAINKLYPGQNYYLHQIDFVTAYPQPMPMMQANYMTKMAASAVVKPLSIGNKIDLQATVVLASLPEAAPKINQQAASH